MKRIKLFKILILSIILFLLCSCKNADSTAYTTKDNYKELNNEQIPIEENLETLEEQNNKKIEKQEQQLEVKRNILKDDIESEDVKDTTFEIHFIDVGQGDSALIMCDDHNLLIDGGSTSSSSLLYTYLKELNIDYLDYVICTHPDEDHIGGLSGALNFASLGVAYCPYINETEPYYNFVKYTEKHGVEIQRPEIGQEFELGSAKVEILSTNIGSKNEASIVTKITFGNNTFLFMGDAGFEVENYLLENYSNLKCDLIKIGHHGSDSSTSQQFISKVSPEYAIISVGENNYGHPADIVLSNLKNTNVKLFRTDMQGDIYCKSDGTNIWVSTERNTLANTYDGIEKSSSISRSIPNANDNNTNEYIYCINISSKKFHYSYCSSVNDMKDHNKKYSNEDREVLIEQGYVPCKRCNP